MNVHELTGAKLDYWVAKALGIIRPELLDNYSPSTNWADGGPIIEREKIKLEPIHALKGGAFRFWNAKALAYVLDMEGETALIAAMRCYVASKLGEEVPDESI